MFRMFILQKKVVGQGRGVPSDQQPEILFDPGLSNKKSKMNQRNMTTTLAL